MCKGLRIPLCTSARDYCNDQKVKETIQLSVVNVIILRGENEESTV